MSDNNVYESIELAAYIREIDGANRMGAAMLAEKIIEWQAARAQGGQGAEVVAWCWENRGRHVTVDKSFAKELIADGEIVRPLVYGYTQPQPAAAEEWREVLAGCVTCFNCPEWSDKCEEYERRARELLSTPTTPQADGWNWCSEKMPKIGQRVILEKDGVIQNYMPVLDMGDEQEGCFWDFEDAADSDPLVDMEFDRWMPLPNARQEGA